MQNHFPHAHHRTRQGKRIYRLGFWVLDLIVKNTTPLSEGGGKKITLERFVLKLSDKGTTHQRQTTTKKTNNSTRMSTATRPTNYTAGRSLST